MIDLFRVRIEPGAAAAVAKVLTPDEDGRTYIGQGPVCEEFERAFGRLVGAPEPPLLLNSCTSAIDLALHLIGVGPGDEVITTPITCTATNSPPALRGARLIWADVVGSTGSIDPESVERLITSRTKAVIAVNWGGRPFDRRLLDLGMPIIEDAAHGPFGENYGDYVCWSFQAIKHLTTGDGGALLAPPNQMERARLLRWYGLDRRSKADFRCEQDIQEIGYKYQSNDIAAAIGLANLLRAEWSVACSQRNAEWYARALALVEGVETSIFDPVASYWIYSLLVTNRASFSAFLKERGIATSQVHRRNDVHSAFRAVSETREPLHGVDFFDAHQVAIPNGFWVGEEERQHIVSAIWEWAESRKAVAA